MPALAIHPSVSARVKDWASAKVDTVVTIGKAAAGNAKSTGVAIGAGALTLAGQAHAALPAEVSATLAEVKDDGTTLGGLVLVIVIAIAAFKFLRRGI